MTTCNKVSCYIKKNSILSSYVTPHLQQVGRKEQVPVSSIFPWLKRQTKFYTIKLKIRDADSS